MLSQSSNKKISKFCSFCSENYGIFKPSQTLTQTQTPMPTSMTHAHTYWKSFRSYKHPTNLKQENCHIYLTLRQASFTFIFIKKLIAILYQEKIIKSKQFRNFLKLTYLRTDKKYFQSTNLIVRFSSSLQSHTYTRTSCNSVFLTL